MPRPFSAALRTDEGGVPLFEALPADGKPRTVPAGGFSVLAAHRTGDVVLPPAALAYRLQESQRKVSCQVVALTPAQWAGFRLSTVPRARRAHGTRRDSGAGVPELLAAPGTEPPSSPAGLAEGGCDAARGSRRFSAFGAGNRPELPLVAGPAIGRPLKHRVCFWHCPVAPVALCDRFSPLEFRHLLLSSGNGEGNGLRPDTGG